MKNSKTHGPNCGFQLSFGADAIDRASLGRLEPPNPEIKPSSRPSQSSRARCGDVPRLLADRYFHYATHPPALRGDDCERWRRGHSRGHSRGRSSPAGRIAPAPRLGPRASAKPLRATLPGPRLARLPRPMSHANPFADDDESSAFAGEGAASFHSTRLVGSSFARDNPFAGARDGDEPRCATREATAANAATAATGVSLATRATRRISVASVYSRRSNPRRARRRNARRVAAAGHPDRRIEPNPPRWTPPGAHRSSSHALSLLLNPSPPARVRRRRTR